MVVAKLDSRWNKVLLGRQIPELTTKRGLLIIDEMIHVLLQSHNSVIQLGTLQKYFVLRDPFPAC